LLLVTGVALNRHFGDADNLFSLQRKYFRRL